MRATRVGEQTMLAEIIHLVEHAPGSKAPIQRLADTVAGIFVPAVLGIAAVTFFGWTLAGYAFGLHPAAVSMAQAAPQPWVVALVAAFAVLVVACPCALGLATPAAIMVGTGQGAEHGVLIQSGASLERLGAVRALVLDKTGTITCGRPELTDIVLETTAAVSGEEALRLAAGAEAASEHPVGRAIVAGVETRGLAPSQPVEAFSTIPGGGVSARVAGHEVLLGTRQLLVERGIPAGTLPILDSTLDKLQTAGKTALLLAVDAAPVAALGVADAVKLGSGEAVARLQREGVAVWMLTGDNPRTAAHVATQVGITQKRVISEVRPGQKAAQVARIQRESGTVAFAGDGINDAPALAQADIGIALGTATAIAMRAADVTLVKGNLRSLVTAVALSRATMRVIRQNLFWAFAYNSVLIPLAIASPAIPGLRESAPNFAAAALALSSVTVVSNSLRLRHFGRSVITASATADGNHLYVSRRAWLRDRWSYD
jgi:Cu+-exporting ATPase